MIYLDTHVVFWLYAEGGAAPLSMTARAAIQGASELRISPIVRLELQYLFEVERTAVPAAPVLAELNSVLGLRICDAPFALVVQAAEVMDWTRDPFDRLIVAQAMVSAAPLVTKDQVMRAHFSGAVW